MIMAGLVFAETVSISPDGVLYMPDNLGRVWTSAEGGAGPLQELAYTGGKPLGGYVYPSGDAIFCDALKVPTAPCTHPVLVSMHLSNRSTCDVQCVPCCRASFK